VRRWGKLNVEAGTKKAFYHLDNRIGLVSYAEMRSTTDSRTAWSPSRASGSYKYCFLTALRTSAVGLAAVLCLFTSGCLEPLSKHATALSAATAPVVDGAAAAYQAANAIHEKKVDFDAIAEFDKTDPVYNPRIIHPLLSDKDVELRLEVLKAFQCYVQTLVEITNGTESKELDEASKSVGSSLANLGNTLAPAPAATATDPTPALTISAGTQNILSTGANALGQFLVQRTIKKDLPQKIKDMDPQVDALCKLLASEMDLLRDSDQKDFDSIINRETLFLRDPASKLSAEERRVEIMKLPEIAREQQAADQRLVQLKSEIVKLELTHHALAAEAQGNNPESPKNKLGDLLTAGKQLGKFYGSLSGN
jgi:hypothetical protein